MNLGAVDRITLAIVLAALEVSCGCQSAQPDPSGGDTQTNWLSVARSNTPYVEDPQVDDRSYQAVVGNINEFGLDLLRSLALDPKNLFFSPVSTAFALSMTYAGARGNTLAEMKATLHNTVADEILHTAMNRLARGIRAENVAVHRDPDGEKSLRLILTDAAWAQKDYTFVSSYLDTLSRNYDAGVQLVDFRKDPSTARLMINQWVMDQTMGKIEDLLGPDSITGDTRLVLTNTLFFYGSWATPFNTASTSNAPFHTLSGADVTVATMHRSERLRYAEGSNYQMADLEYDGGNLVMTLLLPADGQFEAVRSSLSQSWLEGAHAAMSVDTTVNLALPKFKFTWGTSSLKPVLQTLGMKDAFAPPPIADLSGMQPARELFIDDVLHKAFVAVDEYGTEAAAATAVIGSNGSVPMKVREFTVDRPFLFFIRDGSGALLFAGQVVDPTLG